MSNHKDLFVYVSKSVCVINVNIYFCCCLQQLGTSLGYNVAQDTTENTSLLEISRFIEQDIPAVILMYRQ